MFLGGEAVVGESVWGLEREAVELEREIGIFIFETYVHFKNIKYFWD